MTMTVGELGEFGLIAKLGRFLPSQGCVVEGVGDDCAVIRVGERDLLASCDVSIEDVHFRRRTSPPRAIGYRAAASALSDIAAMGGRPLFSLITLGCPGGYGLAFVEEVYGGIGEAMEACGCAVAGGDTSRADGRMFIDVMVVGEAAGGRYLLRRGARAGDALVVTGLLGESPGGLCALERDVAAEELVRAHLYPRPRIAEGQWLCGRPEVHAMIDVSDGLAQDGGHLGEASGLGVAIETERLRVSEALTRFCGEQDLSVAALMLSGGEDYELAFAADAEAVEDLAGAFNEAFGVGVSVVGRFTDAWQGVRVDGEPLPHSGFDHFGGGE